MHRFISFIKNLFKRKPKSESTPTPTVEQIQPEPIEEPAEEPTPEPDGMFHRDFNPYVTLYKSGTGKTLACVDRAYSKKEAISLANAFFKAKKENLKVRYGSIENDCLYFNLISPTATKCYVVHRP